MTLKSKAFILIICILNIGCYNFKGITIAPEMKTFKVENFVIGGIDAPIDLDQLFSERLRRKVREESKLVNDNDTPHIIYSGDITAYNIKYVAPDENNTTSLNRLEISLKVNFTNTLNEEESWTKNYSDFEDFDSTSDFQSIQDGLIDDIIEDIVERIFNDSFTNW